MGNKVSPMIAQIANSEFNKIKSSLINNNKLNVKIKDISYRNRDNVVTATCKYSVGGENITASIKYMNDRSDVYSDVTLSDVYRTVLSKYKSKSSLHKITAAEDDEAFAFEGFDDFGTDDTTDIDSDFGDVSDNNDFRSDFEMDEDSESEDIDINYDEDVEEGVTIDTDNNIAEHYIAECNRCQGIFISAVLQSDQAVEFISGICPLCEKESDQYLKWVIKSVDTLED